MSIWIKLGTSSWQTLCSNILGNYDILTKYNEVKSMFVSWEAPLLIKDGTGTVRPGCSVHSLQFTLEQHSPGMDTPKIEVSQSKEQEWIRDCWDNNEDDFGQVKIMGADQECGGNGDVPQECHQVVQEHNLL